MLTSRNSTFSPCEISIENSQKIRLVRNENALMNIPFKLNQLSGFRKRKFSAFRQEARNVIPESAFLSGLQLGWSSRKIWASGHRVTTDFIFSPLSSKHTAAEFLPNKETTAATSLPLPPSTKWSCLKSSSVVRITSTSSSLYPCRLPNPPPNHLQHARLCSPPPRARAR